MTTAAVAMVIVIATLHITLIYKPVQNPMEHITSSSPNSFYLFFSPFALFFPIAPLFFLFLSFFFFLTILSVVLPPLLRIGQVSHRALIALYTPLSKIRVKDVISSSSYYRCMLPEEGEGPQSKTAGRYKVAPT